MVRVLGWRRRYCSSYLLVRALLWVCVRVELTEVTVSHLSVRALLWVCVRVEVTEVTASHLSVRALLWVWRAACRSVSRRFFWLSMRWASLGCRWRGGRA